MSIFEHDNYDMDYQRYLDWKDEQEQLEKELEGYDMSEEYEYDLLRERQIDDMRAAMYQNETTGERIVRAALSGIAEETEEEEDVRQLAQITVNGIYRYEVEWLPETHEIRVEIDSYCDGSPVYYWYRDTMGVLEVVSQLLGISEEKIRITALAFFTPERVIDDLFDIERRQFLRATWLDYADEGLAMQFNVEIVEEEKPVVCPNSCYDAACDGTNCEFNAPPIAQPHGIDGTQCDCYNCERAVEERWMPEE
jgi:hypothetical protein